MERTAVNSTRTFKFKTIPKPTLANFLFKLHVVSLIEQYATFGLKNYDCCVFRPENAYKFTWSKTMKNA